MKTATDPQRAADVPQSNDHSDPTLNALIWTDTERMSGEPCFRGTRVPVKTLFDHLRCGDPLSEFLDGFPSVSLETAVAVIDLAAGRLIKDARSA